jgi:hypothetical protein
MERDITCISIETEAKEENLPLYNEKTINLLNYLYFLTNIEQS